MFDDFPTRIADLFESFTTRVRAMTVDRAARGIKWVALGLVALTAVSLALIFLFVGAFRIAGELAAKVCDCDQGIEIAYGVIGGLFLLLALFLWSRRTRRSDSGTSS
ncbi:MAG TPA: hypothetical protein VMM81_06225 [Acidimicrobiia bacterium]|nr:hypothetical protein [Acidimicrobiia bacterium]